MRPSSAPWCSLRSPFDSGESGELIRRSFGDSHRGGKRTSDFGVRMSDVDGMSDWS